MDTEAYDIPHPRIERDVGDPWLRVPHYTMDDNNTVGVLYVPNRRGSWNAKAFNQVADAVAFLDRLGSKATN